ncbi:MAG: hypothetical protein ACE5EB_08395 [Thermodesulfobacteriota bacterium]
MKFGSIRHGEEAEYEPWYKWGVIFLYIEMIIAVGVSIYSLYMAFTGTGGFPGKH